MKPVSNCHFGHQQARNTYQHNPKCLQTINVAKFMSLINLPHSPHPWHAGKAAAPDKGVHILYVLLNNFPTAPAESLHLQTNLWHAQLAM